MSAKRNPDIELIEHELQTIQFYVSSLREEEAKGFQNPSLAENLAQAIQARIEKTTNLLPELLKRIGQALQSMEKAK